MDWVCNFSESEEEDRNEDSGGEQGMPELLLTKGNNLKGEHGDRTAVGLLPPDRLLKKTKKKAVRYMELKKVISSGVTF